MCPPLPRRRSTRTARAEGPTSVRERAPWAQHTAGGRLGATAPPSTASTVAEKLPDLWEGWTATGRHALDGGILGMPRFHRSMMFFADISDVLIHQRACRLGVQAATNEIRETPKRGKAGTPKNLTILTLVKHGPARAVLLCVQYCRVRDSWCARGANCEGCGREAGVAVVLIEHRTKYPTYIL